MKALKLFKYFFGSTFGQLVFMVVISQVFHRYLGIPARDMMTIFILSLVLNISRRLDRNGV